MKMKEDVPAAFHASVVEDPLFAAEGMDIDNASGALDDLVPSLSRIEREYAGDFWSRKLFFVRYPLQRYAMPLPFLRVFLECERARREYLAVPSGPRAAALVALWKMAAGEYEACARRYRTLHRLLVRLESDERTFVMSDMFGYRSSYRYIANFLDFLVENGQKLRNIADGREQLLMTGVANIATKGPPVKDLSPLKEGRMEELYARLHAAEVRGGVSPFRYADIVETRGPLRYTLANFDGAPTERLFMFYLLRERSASRKILWLDAVDKAYVHTVDFSKMPDGVTRGAYATLVGITKKEVPYWYEPATYPYNTRDFGYWMDIATRVDQERRPALDRRLLSMQKSSLFDCLLGICAIETRAMIGHLIRRKRSETARSYSMCYDLMTRSYPSVFYLTFNASVWRLPEKAQLLGESYGGMNASFYLSQSEIAGLPPDTIANIMGAARLRERRGKAAGWLP